MKLVYIQDLREVKIGDVVRTATLGEEIIVLSFNKPHKPCSEGKVYVKHVEHDWKQEFYVSVIGAKWIEREDRGYRKEDICQ